MHNAVSSVFCQPKHGNKLHLPFPSQSLVPEDFTPEDRPFGGGNFRLGDILVRPAGEDAEHLPLVATEFSERHPALSPDGGWLAYTSNETGRDEVFVIPFPEGGGRWAVSSAGGSEPLWAHSGRELFYRSGDGSMVAVPVETEGTFSFGAPRVLFSALDFRVTGYHPNWDVAPDDERFIMVRRLGDEVPGRVILVQNFLTELEDRVGGGD